MSTIFTKIINREIPGQFIYEDELCVAFMDAFPSIAGQSLVVLKREVDYAFAMNDEEYTHLFAIAKKIALASDKAFNAKRTCLVVEGFEVPHVHIKLYPFQTTEEANLVTTMSQTVKADPSTLAEQAERIKAEL